MATMILGLKKRTTPKEMTYEDFVETYGRLRHSGSESVQKRQSATSEKIQSVESKIVNSKTNSGCESDKDQFQHRAIFKSNRHSMILSSNPPSAFESRRRSTKLQNMASKLSRKSFRGSKKKTANESPPSAPDSPSKILASNNKWKPFAFKRSKSTTRNECDRSSLSSLPLECDKAQSNPQAMTLSAKEHNRSFVRSISHSPSVTSSSISSASTKRASLNSDDEATKQQLNDKINFKKFNFSKPYATTAVRETRVRPTLLPLTSKSVTSPQPFSPEYDVIKKFDDIREGEETRLVAIATLLKRRKNSLKIKCDQFDKELSQKNLDEERAKVIRARMRHMKKKLEVVNQCLEEQVEERKATTAKVDLILSLELYKLNLIEEEKNGFSSRKSRSSLTICSPLSISSSCETLLSMDDACVFDDASSVTSSKKDDSNHSSPTRHWRRYSVFGTTPSSSLSTHAINFSCDELPKVKIHTNRSQSVDNTVTSDCDSGFDNGEGLSQSDVSLNRSFSKSTGSIESGLASGSHSNTGNSSRNSHGQYFFPQKPHSSSEIFLYRGKRKSSNMCSSTNKLEESSEVDPGVLAKIEDFEKFAEKTRRRLSLNGKLVPLKKGF